MTKENKLIDNNLETGVTNTWCPGCLNFMILAGVKMALQKQFAQGKKKEDFAMVSGIGCHAKIFDYLNLNGLNSLHGRVLPPCLGLKIGNPNLTVLGFSGDGDAYAEGMEHLIHTARYNPDVKYLVHNNQVFALTVGEPTPCSEQGYMDKTTTPIGVLLAPMNPIKLMLASGCSFVARVFSDVNQIQAVMEEAFKHKGFCFIEIIQPCIIFHPDKGVKEKTYNLQQTGHDKSNYQEAMKKAEEFDYNKITDKTKIPLGIFYQTQKPVYEELFPQMQKLKKEKKIWKDLKR